jgi:hypothetical protein
MKNLDLVALSKVESTYCFTGDGNGGFIPDHPRITIKIDFGDGSRKYINIHRQNKLYETGINHVIESYTLKGDGIYSNETGRRWKMYDTEKFEARLKKIEKELSKIEYQII